MIVEKLHSIWLKIKFSAKVRQFFAAGAASHGSLALGMTIGWFPQAMETMMKDPDIAPLLTRTDIGLMVLLVIVGALTSLIPATYSAYKFGRVWTMRIFCLVLLLGWILIAAAVNVEMILAGRFLLGFSCGAFSIVVPLYLVEIAEIKYRGILGYMYTQQIYGGVLLALLSARHAEWPILSLHCAPIAIVFFILSLFMPETPIHYLRQDNVEKAQESLRWLRATDQIDEEFSKLQEFLNDEPSEGNSNRITFKNLFQHQPYGKLFGTTLILMIFQQLICIGPFQFYTVWITLISGDGSKLKPTTVAIIITFVAAIGMGITSFLSDKKSRQKLLTISCSLMVLCFGILGILYYLDPTSERLYWGQFTLFCLLILTYAFGFLSIPHILMVEGAHPRYSEITVFLITSCQWITILLISLFIGALLKNVSIGPLFWICSTICFVAALTSYNNVPNTHGKSLNEIQMVDRDGQRHSGVINANAMSSIPI